VPENELTLNQYNMNPNLLYSPKDVFSAARDEAEIESLLNNDVYKFLMLDFILANEQYKNLNVRWEMKIRNPDVRSARVIDR
jgi:hypothetical protein